VQRINTVATDNLQALEAYLHGRQLMAARDAKKMALAVAEFNKATELDPDFALAWVGVADSHLLLAFYGRTLSNEESFPIREDAIKRAFAINENLGEAHASLGQLHRQQNRFEESENAYKEAIQLSPNYATAWQWYSQLLSIYPQRSSESIKLLEKAAELDPRSSIIGMNLANQYRKKGLYSLAERQLLKLNELNPDFAIGKRTLVGFYTKDLSRFDLAFNYALKSQSSNPENLNSLYQLSDIYLNLDDPVAAEKIHEQMNELDANDDSVGQLDVMINLYKNNLAGAREALNWLIPKRTARPSQISSMGFLALVLGDKSQARKLYLYAHPGWLDPAKWPELINLSENDGCTVAWILINTGDEELGRQLLQLSTLRYDETLPTITEHTDLYLPETCYLTAGDTEKALQSIEKQLAHNHLSDWYINHQLPMYELIRHEPRYQAAMAERERRVSIQRDAIAAMGVEDGL
jgi:tetratricopeptide (TPR) repeat protein